MKKTVIIITFLSTLATTAQAQMAPSRAEAENALNVQEFMKVAKMAN